MAQVEIPAFTKDQMEFIRSVMFTPEKMAALVQEMKKPYIDQTQIDREKRENQKTKDDFRRTQENKKALQARCRHKDARTNASKISLVHFGGMMPMGHCADCDLMIMPATWDFKSDGTPFQVPAHPQYQMVMDLEAGQYSEYAAAV